MGRENYDNLMRRTKKAMVTHLEGGTRILQSDDAYLDVTCVRAAANQLRQAVKALDEIDGMLQAVEELNRKD